MKLFYGHKKLSSLSTLDIIVSFLILNIE